MHWFSRARLLVLTLISALSDKATPIIGCRHDGQGRPTRPSPRIACSHSGLIDSDVKRLRSSSMVTARPPQTSQLYKMPPEVRTSFSGTLQRGQRNSEAVLRSISSCSSSATLQAISYFTVPNVWPPMMMLSAYPLRGDRRSRDCRRSSDQQHWSDWNFSNYSCSSKGEP